MEGENQYVNLQCFEPVSNTCSVWIFMHF